MTAQTTTTLLHQLGYTAPAARTVILVGRETKSPATWQIAFDNGATWAVCGDLASRSGLAATKPNLYQFDVPVVLTTGTDDNKRRAILAAHSDPRNPAGFANLPAMLVALERIGCRVEFPRRHYLGSVPGAFSNAPEQDMNE